VSALALALAGGVLFLPPLAVLAALAALGFVTVALLRPRTGLLFWIVTTPVLTFWVAIRLGAGVPDLTYDRLFVATLLGVLVLRVILHLGRFPQMGRTELAMVVFVLLAGLSLVQSHQFTSDLQLLLDAYVVPFLIFWIARALYSEGGSPSTVLWALIGLGGLLLGLGTVQFVTGKLLLVPSGFLPIHGGRMTGPFVNAAEFGAVLAIIGTFCLAFVGRVRNAAARWAATAGVALLFAGAACSLTRAVWVASAAGMIAIAWRSPRVRRLLPWLAGTAVALIWLPYVWNPAVWAERTANIGSIHSRIIAMATAVRMWVHEPLLGYGFGRWVFYDNSREFLAPLAGIPAERASMVDVPHNEFLHILVLSGAVGLIAYLVIFLGALKAAARWRGLADPHWRCFTVGFGAATVVYLVTGQFVDLVFLVYLNMLFYFLFGVVIGLLDRERADRVEPG
jgi:hypothetical protein